MTDTQALQRQIAQLPALDRIALVEDILQGLDAPDKSLDALWASEAETRLAAYKAGQVKAVPLSEVLTKYRLS
jgi:putative addiction module component (TIGR02574 family)